MGPFDDGELVQESQEINAEETPELEAGEIGEEPEGDEVPEAGDQLDEEEGEAGDQYGGYKSIGGLYQAYAAQRERLGLPLDLQNYTTPDALLKALERDKKRLEKSGKTQPQTQTETDSANLEDMDSAALLELLQKQQAEVMAKANGQQQVVQPNNQVQPQQVQQQQYQAQQYQQQQTQPLPQQMQREPHSLDNWQGDPEAWLQDVLLTKGPKAVLDIVREEVQKELNFQGGLLGQSLNGVLMPMAQGYQAMKRQVDYDREARELDDELKDSGDRLKNYAKYMDTVYQQYPILGETRDGMRQALEMAKTLRQIDLKKHQQSASNKAAARIPSSGGAGIPKATMQRGQEDPGEKIRREIFGDTSKPKGPFD